MYSEHAREVYPLEYDVVHGDAELLATPHHYPYYTTAAHHYSTYDNESKNGSELSGAVEPNSADVADDWHRKAHADQGYWTTHDLIPKWGEHPHTGSVMDHGHFRAEEHGAYHYVSPEETGHHNLYYAYGDAREFTPHHVDEYHDVHGVEHHPDDWIQAKPIHDTLFAAMHHDVNRHHSSEHDLARLAHAHSYAADDFNHDATFHSGSEMKRDIETEYDDLFHALEAGIRHPIEHSDVETLTRVTEEHPQPHSADWHTGI